MIKKKKSNSKILKFENGSNKIEQDKSKGMIDLWLLTVIIIISIIGLIMVLSASNPTSLVKQNDSYYFFYKQLQGLIVGIVVMIFFIRVNINFTNTRFWKWVIYGAAILSILVVLIPGVGVRVNGAYRWINFPLGRFQPSELTKILLIFFFANYFADEKREKSNIMIDVIGLLILLGIPLFMIFKIQNHLSAAIIILMFVGLMFLFSRIPSKKIWAILSIFLISTALGIFIFRDKIANGSFRSDRIEAWLKTFEDDNPTRISYQTVQGLYGIGSGGLLGVGPGQSRQKYSYIPEAHNDYIFAIFAEEYGVIGAFILMLAFLILGFRGLKIAINAENHYLTLIAIGITGMVIVQAILNIGVVTNSIPSTGISLPFVSYGNTSLVMLLGAMGILLNISRNNKKIV